VFLLRKNHAEVDRLIAGSKVFICNECIELCVDILKEGTPKRPAGEGLGTPILCDFCGLRRDMKGALRIRERWMLCRSCTHAVRTAIWGGWMR
jgi:hypothetical protein